LSTKAPISGDPVLIYTEPMVESATKGPSYRVWADDLLWSSKKQSATATGNVVIEGPEGLRIEGASAVYDHQDHRLNYFSKVTILLPKTKPDGKNARWVAEGGTLVLEASRIQSARFHKVLSNEEY
jgi:lipopolysaccharide assembly outer membrane protein LptD (OstA)